MFKSNADLFAHYAKRGLANPYLLRSGIVAWLRGWWCRVKFFLLCKNFRAGKWFRVYGSFNVTGPGRVVFGNNCIVISDAIKPVCIRTLSQRAVVELGDHCGLNGTSIQCVEKVLIGRLSNIADAYIADSPAHSLSVERRMETIEDVSSCPVIIGENVWVSVQVVILDGVVIGDNSVIGACSLVRNAVPENVFAVGNPLVIIRNIHNG